MVGRCVRLERRKLVLTSADTNAARRWHQEIAGERGAVVVEGDLLGRRGFHFCGDGKVRDGEGRCHRHGNSNTVLFRAGASPSLLKPTCLKKCLPKSTVC